MTQTNNETTTDEFSFLTGRIEVLEKTLNGLVVELKEKVDKEIAKSYSALVRNLSSDTPSKLEIFEIKRL